MRVLVFVLLAACATPTSPRALDWAANAQAGCSTEPALPGPVGFRHVSSRLAARLGEPRHRGIDVVAAGDAAVQTIRGELGYSALDKALEDEAVEIYACVAGSWRRLGETRTDGDGHFALALRGDARLPAGLHDLRATVPGDRTSAAFTAFIATSGAPVFVCDVDGTLTESENAIVGEVMWHARIAAKPGAARVLAELAARGYQPIYVTARPRIVAELTRRWLAEQGMPRGPVILQPGLTLPGAASLAAKSQVLDALLASGLRIEYGIGNRATDILAYARAGLPAARIWIEASQYSSEIRPFVARGLATAFSGYAEAPGVTTVR